MLVTYNGPIKQFFKDFPVEKRKFNVIYKIINNSGVKFYEFRGTLGEKHFRYYDTEALFDITDLSDLPEKISKSLICSNVSLKKEIAGLFFKTNRLLSADNILVGYYRTYHKTVTRHIVLDYLSLLYRSGFLEKEGHLYKRNRK